MAQVSTARKLAIAARVAGQQIRKSRTFAVASRAAQTSAGHLGRVLGQLWLEVTGFVFLTLAGIGSLAFLREYARYREGRAGSGRVVVAICFTLLFAWFGLSSFWRVRKKG
ncbi:MAG TPA: hypothetical protein VEK33_06775 [Terriglobales bacterium]|nr:hypothetical protein [Terriglobales bacterium]